MHMLDKSMRRALENTILEARSAAEEAARIVLESLGVGEKVPFLHLNETERTLRRRLRAHGRQLGDYQFEEGKQSIDALTEEVAYEHWHRMLFARFLSENDLLMDDDPVSPISLTLEECNDLAPSLGARNGWDLAARYASRMLPQIFKSDSPIFSLEFPIERQKTLEQLVSSIPVEVFHASDSLGWVYQFWQTKRKKAINDSGVKIGARELPAVTQLFTEPYMVSFLLDNSLGAWWAAKRLNSDDLLTATEEQELRDKAYIDHLPLEYLRFVKDEESEFWKPAGGSFNSWPKHLSEFKMLDPSCGSGHFLVATLQMLVPMRMELEGLTEDEAIQKVLEENIHGLELDQRCVELAAFALAFAAWTYPGSSGYRQLPTLHIACSGQAINISDEELIKLSSGNHELYNALEDLRNKFHQAPILGSLIDPKSSIQEDELFSLDWEEVGPLLDSALRKYEYDDLDEAGIVAQGLAKAASLLVGIYHFVVTNVPYLKSGYHVTELKEFCAMNYPEAKYDLATVFIERCNNFLCAGGSLAVVSQQYWLFLKYYTELRKKLLQKVKFAIIARLGTGAFETINGEVVNVYLQISINEKAEVGYSVKGFELDDFKGIIQKQDALKSERILLTNQKTQLNHPDNRISFEMEKISKIKLSNYADFGKGSVSGDGFHYLRKFFEYSFLPSQVNLWLNSPAHDSFWSGRENVIVWNLNNFYPNNEIGFALRGHRVFEKKGIAIGKAGILRFTPYLGGYFDDNVMVICPNDLRHLESIWSYCTSASFKNQIKKLDKKMSVTAGTFTKVPFELEVWTKAAEDKYPKGLSLPFSDDPTQWIFHGHPCKSVVWDDDVKWTTPGPIRTDSSVLHKAIARLLGYRWPAELDPKMELSEEQRALVNECEALLPLADKDGIVCIPSVGGEFSAADRLLKMLKASYDDTWTDDTLSILLKNTDAPGKTLEAWLRDKFFLQHCKLFGDRPFIWHIWDGLPDGFSALVNYHKLDYKKLETLIYTYLGDWLQRQKIDTANKVEGAREKLVAAQYLTQTLELILEGEKPFDIFVRWKSLEEQPLGWNPDLNDGVRLNIRPFMSVPDVGKKGAGVLRDKPNIKWNKDRGQDVETAPWYSLGPLYGGKKGDRINDHHLSLEEKIKAREAGSDT